MVAIVDYGMGNLRSVQKALERLGVNVIITSDQEAILEADKIVLPGVGHFKKGIESLKELNLIETLNNKVIKQETPILGICLGMQLMTIHSEEGDVDGLSWINASTYKFQFHNKKYTIPHIGWNRITVNNQSPIFDTLSEKDFLYFVHSYYVKTEENSIIASTTTYGDNTFVSAFQKKNIFGMQFHPEKSHDQGLRLLNFFLDY